MRQARFTEAAVICAALVILLTWAVNLMADVSSTPKVPRIEQLQVGFDDNYKVGYWTPVWITLSGGHQPFQGQLEVVVPDGDGVQTRYTGSSDRSIQIDARQDTTILRYVKIGRVGASLTVRLLQDHRVVAERFFTSEEFPQAALSIDELLVTVGGDIGVEDALKLHRNNSAESRRSIGGHIQSAERLPDRWLGYESVDTLVISTSDLDLVRELTPDQIEAMEAWISLGGKLLLCVGVNGSQLLDEGQALAVFSPGQFDRLDVLRKTVDLETFAKASQRLDTIAGAAQLPITSLRQVHGQVQSQEVNVGDLGPTIVRSPYGFGQIVFVAVDLDQPPFSNWPDRPRLVAKLLQDQSASRIDDDGDYHRGRLAHEGYHDLVGQLRTAMDQFNGVTLVSFTFVAFLTVLYILVIGPGDYYLLSRLVGRMEWTWITFPLSVLLFCVLAFLLVKVFKTPAHRMNQVELIDIDTTSSLVRGTMWSHVYSPATSSYELSFRPKIPCAAETSEVLLSWQGLPGDGLGGLNNRSTAELLSQPYSIISQFDPRRIHETRLSKMPIQVSSTKTIQARWSGRVVKPVHSRLHVEGRDDLLRGQFTSPLEVELSDCTLAYGTWMYRLDRKLAPRETVDVQLQMYERSLAMHLTRRSAEEESNPWDQASVDIPRILEIMMFHQAAGGRAYTNLWHRYQSYVDLSGHLELDRAILTGWTSEPAGELVHEGPPLASDEDRNWTIYRVVFPVEPMKR